MTEFAGVERIGLRLMSAVELATQRESDRSLAAFARKCRWDVAGDDLLCEPGSQVDISARFSRRGVHSRLCPGVGGGQVRLVNCLEDQFTIDSEMSGWEARHSTL